MSFMLTSYVGSTVKVGSILLRPFRNVQASHRYLSSSLLLYGGSSSSSKRWLNRQKSDVYTKAARLENYASRAAYKLIEINDRFKIFRPGMTVVDLGFAPGSWSQVAYSLTKPYGRVVGVDMLLAQPPRGVSAIQGNFLDPAVQQRLKNILVNPLEGRAVPKRNRAFIDESEALAARQAETKELRDLQQIEDRSHCNQNNSKEHSHNALADVVLSDMCGIWPQATGFWLRSVNDPYFRLSNTSGLSVRDHASSIVSFSNNLNGFGPETNEGSL